MICFIFGKSVIFALFIFEKSVNFLNYYLEKGVFNIKKILTAILFCTII